jgi:hypothetical protein
MASFSNRVLSFSYLSSRSTLKGFSLSKRKIPAPEATTSAKSTAAWSQRHRPRLLSVIGNAIMIRTFSAIYRPIPNSSCKSGMPMSWRARMRPTFQASLNSRHRSTRPGPICSQPSLKRASSMIGSRHRTKEPRSSIARNAREQSGVKARTECTIHRRPGFKSCREEEHAMRVGIAGESHVHCFIVWTGLLANAGGAR